MQLVMIKMVNMQVALPYQENIAPMAYIYFTTAISLYFSDF
jgi:hypothetical protein